MPNEKTMSAEERIYRLACYGFADTQIRGSGPQIVKDIATVLEAYAAEMVREALKAHSGPCSFHRKPCQFCMGFIREEGRKEGRARLKELLDEKARLCFEEAAQIAETIDTTDEIEVCQTASENTAFEIAEAIRARVRQFEPKKILYSGQCNHGNPIGQPCVYCGRQ